MRTTEATTRLAKFMNANPSMTVAGLMRLSGGSLSHIIDVKHGRANPTLVFAGGLRGAASAILRRKVRLASCSISVPRRLSDNALREPETTGCEDPDVPPSDPCEFSRWLKASECRRAEMLDLLPPAEVSVLLHVSTPTLSNWRSSRRGARFVKIGSGVWYRRRDLLAFIGAHLIGTKSQLVSISGDKCRREHWTECMSALWKVLTNIHHPILALGLIVVIAVFVLHAAMDELAFALRIMTVVVEELAKAVDHVRANAVETAGALRRLYQRVTGGD